MKVKRFESNLVPLWVLDDGGPFALAHSKLRGNDSMDVISLSSGTSVMKGPTPAIPLMEQLFVNDLMGIFHFTDGQNAPINNQADGRQTNTDTQVKDFNQIVNYRHKSIDLQKGLKFIEVRCGSV